MTDELNQLLVIAIVLTPIATALMELLKSSTKLSGRVIPFVTVALGVVLGVVWAYVNKHSGAVGTYALAGFLSGLGAGGFYNIIKPTTTKEAK